MTKRVVNHPSGWLTYKTAKGSKKDQLQRQIEKTDREIDDLVYKLYGITEKEREIIEGTG